MQLVDPLHRRTAQVDDDVGVLYGGQPVPVRAESGATGIPVSVRAGDWDPLGRSENHEAGPLYRRGLHREPRNTCEPSYVPHPTRELRFCIVCPLAGFMHDVA